MAAILEFDESTANSIANALGSNTFLFTDASQIPAHECDGRPLVIIGPSVDQAVAERVTAAANMANPTGGVVWLRRRVDTTVVRGTARWSQRCHRGQRPASLGCSSKPRR